MTKRGYYKKIWADFDKEKHLVLVSGPRQAGKTTFAKDIASQEPVSLYFNYDIPDNKVKILQNPTFFEELDREKGNPPLIILDEIHKYKDWKNYLKGIYDGYSDEFRFLATGSGCLELSRKKGDSLAGRYLHFHLYPFTVGELFASSTGMDDKHLLLEIPEQDRKAQEVWEAMFHVSGFPEPFLKGTKLKYRRWTKSYHSQVIRDDIRDEYAVRQIDTMEALYFLLSECVGNPFSSSNYARTLKISHKTVSSWISVFERFFLVFRLRPYSRRIARSLVKEPKVYFYDYCKIEDHALRFENMVAVELNRAVTLWSDFGLGEYDLWYLRNKEKEEVDFLVTERGKPQFMVDAKLSDTAISPHLLKFQNALGVPAIQLVNTPNVATKIRNASNTIIVASAPNWLACLN
ncbi:MAG: ATP-binding protein [Deltaproteobacteria bacterium]|nr:ATP-binding protein [Deltaproteobacteria bacterium]